MIRLIIILTLAFMFLDAKSDIDQKIKNTNNSLSSFNKNKNKINKKMSDNARAILKQKQKILKQQKFLQNLLLELDEKEISYKSNIQKLKNLKINQKNLKINQEKIEEKLVFTIAKSVSLSIILDEEFSTSEESLIEFEVLNEMLKVSKEKANTLNDKFFINSKKIDKLNIDISFIEVSIATIASKKKKLEKTQKENNRLLKKLKKLKLAYKKELKKVLKKQDLLKKTLSKLNIIKIDEHKKAKEQAARKKAFEAKQMVSDKDLPKVKKHGSSYQKAKTKKYRGKKTIAPLDSYTITKKYGTYTDPIYGIKVFNESISMKPKKSNAKVKTVFNGKVIYADKTAVLNNIVIVEHKNGLHTIYANLSQISTNLKKGIKIKKGYTIGRVSDELIFEVTQKSFHINPIRLFK